MASHSLQSRGQLGSYIPPKSSVVCASVSLQFKSFTTVALLHKILFEWLLYRYHLLMWQVPGCNAVLIASVTASDLKKCKKFLFCAPHRLCQPLSCLILQMFSDYQMQEMSENFIDSFGFHDDEFTESDENVGYCDH